MRKVRKFREGGGADYGTTSYADSGSGGGTKIGFKDAFRAARKQGLKNFSWQGKKYTTELASEKKPEPKKSDDSGSEPVKPSSPSTRGGARRQEITVTAKRDKPAIPLPGDRATQFAKDMRGLDEERAKSALRSMGTAASLAPMGRAARAIIGTSAARRSIGERGLEMSKREKTAEQMEKFRKQMEARQKLSRGSTYKSGGGVKKYARGGGIEVRGKTKGRMC